MNTQDESVTTIYKGEDLVAIVKRDSKTRRAVVYMVSNAKVEDIKKLIGVITEE